MENPSQNVIKLLLYGGGTGKSRDEQDQIYVINVYSVLGFLALVVFGVLHIMVEGNAELGRLEVASGAVIALNAVGLRLTHNVALTRTFFLFALQAVLLAMLITGGIQGTGIFWMFAFPMVAFFLTGQKTGMWWISSLYLMILAVVGLSEFSLIHIPYTLIDLRQLIVSLAVVTVGVYIYQGAREQALKQAQASGRDLQEYLDHMTTFCVKVGLDGRVAFANKIAKEVSGLGEHMIGAKFLEGTWWAFDPAVQRRVEATFYKVLTGKTVTYDERMRVATTQGEIILTVNFSMIPIFEGERLAYVLAEARDISAEKEVDRAKSEFIALASRQLRAPVAAIARSTDALLNKQGGHLSDDQRQYVEQVHRENQRMGALLNDMLLVSSLELGNLPVRPVETNVVQLTQAVVQEVTARHLTGRQLKIGEDYTARLPTIAADPEIVRTVLRNLIVNAVKYTPDAGHVLLRINLTQDKVHSESKGSLQVEVQDSGQGIPDDAQKKLFTKFFRAKNTPGSDDGTGLGLYLTKGLLDYVGGSISFTSKEHVGTIFVVLLPLEGMTEKAGAVLQAS
jgi:PAS domain S-box-containing protein